MKRKGIRVYLSWLRLRTPGHTGRAEKTGLVSCWQPMAEDLAATAAWAPMLPGLPGYFFAGGIACPERMRHVVGGRHEAYISYIVYIVYIVN